MDGGVGGGGGVVGVCGVGYEKDTFFGLQLWKVICTYEMWKQP